MSVTREQAILVVDDERETINAFNRCLKSSGFKLYFAESGSEAVALLEENSIDLVISDIRMPGMSGNELMTLIAKKWPSIIRIVMTGFEDIDETIKAINSGKIAYYLTKPWDNGQLKIIVSQFLTNKILLEEKESMRRVTEQQNEQLKLLNEKYKQLSTTDVLTGMYNRRHFADTFQKEIYRAVRNEQNIALLICDIDYFKQYNDSLGHNLGDQCIRSVADIIKELFRRSTDMAARYGGDEFIIVMSDVKDPNSALQSAENLCRAVCQKKIAHPESKIAKFVTVSIGFAIISPDRNNKDIDLIDQVDNALYRAKKNGRNQVAD